MSGLPRRLGRIPDVSISRILMKTENNLLFGLVALQNGAVDADRLAETCAHGGGPSMDLRERLVMRDASRSSRRPRSTGLSKAR